MKLKCIKEYYDKEKEEYIKKDAIFDIDSKRANTLINHGVAQEIKEKKENNGNTGAIK